MAISDEAKPKPVKKKEKKGFVETFIPLKTDSAGTITAKCITLAAVASLIVCVVILVRYYAQIIEAKKLQENIKYIYSNAAEAQVTETAAETVEAPAEDTPVVREPKEIMPAAQELLNINSDTVGYIKIPNTMIDTVVVQTDNNDYYLTHNFNNQKRQCGAIFLDYRCKLTDWEQSDNLIVYGHNQADGTMFGEMDFYRWDYNYYKKNPVIYFNSNYEQGVYKIISSFVINTEPEHDNGKVFDYQNYVYFSDQYPYETFIKEITERSTIITGTDVNENDKFLTLSTCSTEWEPSRHVIVARKVRPGESPEVDLTKFQINPNPKWPAIYYKYNGGTYIEED